MKKLLATTALLTSTLGVLGFVGASQAFATASQTQTGQVAQDKINLDQAQAKANAAKQMSASKSEVKADKGAVISDADKLKSDEAKDLADAKANGATVGTLVGEEAKQVGAQDKKKVKSIALIDQQLAQKAAADAQKAGAKTDPAALYCTQVGGHAHIGKGITGKETQYCYLPNNTRAPAKKVYQAALKGKGTITPAKSVTHLTKEQKQDITDENQQLKQDAAEKQNYEKREASK